MHKSFCLSVMTQPADCTSLQHACGTAARLQSAVQSETAHRAGCAGVVNVATDPDEADLWPHTEEEIQGVQASGPSFQEASGDHTLSHLKAEAAQKGFGKFYAAFGGGKAGLQACEAGALQARFKRRSKLVELMLE